MLYVAKHHIGLGNGRAYPGEVLDDLDEKTAKWLLSTGAIAPVTEETAPAAPEADTAEDEPEEVSAEPAVEPEPAAPTIDALDGITPTKKSRGRKTK